MSTSQDLLPHEPNPEAEAAYLEFLKARDSGAGVTFSELCQKRPELADDLRLLRDTFDPEAQKRMGEWMAEHGAKLGG